MAGKITNPKTGETIETVFSDTEALKLFGRINSGFSDSIVASIKNYGRATEAQMFWVHKLAAEQHCRENNACPASQNMIYPNIVDFVQRGGSRGAITFRTAENHTIKIKTAGTNSRYAGQLWITDGGAYGNSRFYGRVDLNGRFHPGRDFSGDVAEFLIRALAGMDSNPAEYAGRYGKETGNCCFCNTEIENPISLAVGYGPVCAKRYGLPHSMAAMKCAISGRK